MLRFLLEIVNMLNQFDLTCHKGLASQVRLVWLGVLGELARYARRDG